MEVLFFNFANSRSAPLPSLQEEDDSIYKSLSTRALKQHFLLHRESYTTLSKVAEYLVLYRDHISCFHYSGHAGRDVLVLEDDAAQAGGIAHLLGQCPGLKLVVLNGCSTKGQVDGLLAAGVPVVIATSAPVEDNKATRFGIRFYQALESQLSIKEAFEMAIGEVMGADAGIEAHRSFKVPETKAEGPLWGLFWREDKEAVLEEKLPVKSIVAVPESYKPNEKLIQTLWESLGDYSDSIMSMASKEKKGIPVTLAKKRMAILNSLPAPIAEHLRKLMVPVEDENEGFDKPSEARLRQIVRSYQTIVEVAVFTMLSQLWEAFLEKPGLPVSPEHRELISAFLTMKAEDQAAFDYIALIRTIGDILEENESPYFVPELQQLRQAFYEGGDFQTASFFLETLRQKLDRQTVSPPEVVELCIRAEENLASILASMGFLARYTLATVKNIDVEKYRHRREPTFSHKVVMLLDVLGGLEEQDLPMEKYMDNRSVLLLKTDEEDMTFLNLSPFIIDENAFEKDTDVSKLFFLSHFEPGSNSFCYKYVNKPDDLNACLRVSEERYPKVNVQFEALKDLLQYPEPAA